LSISSEYLSTTLSSHNSTPEAYEPLAIAWAAVGEVINMNTAQIIALAPIGPEPLAKATPIKRKMVPRVYAAYDFSHQNFCPPNTSPMLSFL
jgi:hypothetical protein